MTKRRPPPRWLGPKPLDHREPPAPVPPDLDDTRPRSIHDAVLPFPPMFWPGSVDEPPAPKTDLEAFREFFDAHGVPYGESDPSYHHQPPTEPVTLLSVAAGVCVHFVFNAAGRFVALDDDEIGERVARKP